MRSFAHALEEVFESFWHLDGRIFRSLRRLLRPGALAGDYLAGRRAPYVAPMRLFVLLCVLTFFVGKLVVHFGGEPGAAPAVAVGRSGVEGELAAAFSPGQARKIRDRALANLREARDGLPPELAPARYGFERSMQAVRRQARDRIVELGGTPSAADAVNVAEDAAEDAKDAKAAPPRNWIERQGRCMEQNLPRLQQDPERLKVAFMGSVPTALFVLVPLFALLLKLFYVGTGRVYLEHLVVALYSHAFLCLALLGQFALLALDPVATPRLPAFGAAHAVLSTLLWLWMPIYLLLMQKRVYGQGWWLTGLKFAVLGSVYLSLLSLAALGLLLVSLARA